MDSAEYHATMSDFTPRQRYKAAIIQGLILRLSHDEVSRLKTNHSVRKSEAMSAGQLADELLADDADHEARHPKRQAGE